MLSSLATNKKQHKKFCWRGRKRSQEIFTIFLISYFFIRLWAHGHRYIEPMKCVAFACERLVAVGSGYLASHFWGLWLNNVIVNALWLDVPCIIGIAFRCSTQVETVLTSSSASTAIFICIKWCGQSQRKRALILLHQLMSWSPKTKFFFFHYH